MESKNRIWDSSLTAKLVYLLKISPIVNIKGSYLQDKNLKEQYKHYDPLAIALKMLEIIIDNMGPYTGITEENLFEKICPRGEFIRKTEENLFEKIYQSVIETSRKERPRSKLKVIDEYLWSRAKNL